MATTTREKLITAEELARMHIGESCELVKGRIVYVSPAGFNHGHIAARIARLIDRHADRRGLGEVLSADTGYWVERDPDTVRAPDVAFLTHRSLRRAEAARTSFCPLGPELAVEVRSPDNTVKQLEEKASEYLAAGSKAVWLVFPDDRQVHVHVSGRPARVLGIDDAITGGKALPGFRALVREFFEGRPRRAAKKATSTKRKPRPRRA